MVQTFAAVQQAPTMFLCVPLRLGVFLNAALTISLSCILLLCGHDKLHLLHVFMGGYAQQSRVVCGAMEFTGMIWGIMGLMGAWQNEAKYVKVFNYFQAFRIVAWIWMYFIDVPIMLDCELWITDIDKAIKQQGWNPYMYNIAMGGKCYSERNAFFVGSTLCFILFIYCWVSVSRFINTLEYEPRYLLRVPKEIPSGSFYAETIAEREWLSPEMPALPPTALFAQPAPRQTPGYEILPGATLRTPHGTFPTRQASTTGSGHSAV